MSLTLLKKDLEQKSGPAFNVSHLNKLPQVGIVYNYANASDLPVKALRQAKFDGIVSVGVGNGNLYHSIFSELEKASKEGIMVLRSSRTSTGPTTLDAEIDDDQFAFVASGLWHLEPRKITHFIDAFFNANPRLQRHSKNVSGKLM